MEYIVLGILSWLFGLVILILIIRYAVDSSKAASRLEDLTHEVRMLRKELKQFEQEKLTQHNQTQHFDKRI